MVTDKCISANDMQIHQQKGDKTTFKCNNIHAEQAFERSFAILASSWLPKAVFFLTFYSQLAS